jgi:CelD/BcsL family acetyltransferase involved in cellulose biosynthesis
MRPDKEMKALAATAEGVEYATISTESSFADLGETWDELVGAMPRPSPFLLHAWILEWLRHYGGAAELAVHVAFRDGKLAAALPLVVQSRRGLRVTRFVGGNQTSLADLLLAPGEELSLATSLVRRASSQHDFAELFGLAGDSRLAQIADPAGLRLFQRIEAPVLDLAPGWEAVYQAKTSSKKRNLLRRRRRQLGELGRLEVVVARSRRDLGAALEEAFRLHALRWQGRPDGSGFVTPVGKRFHRAVIDRLAGLDAPRIVLLKLDGRAIAFHYYLLLEGRMYAHRLGFDPALARFSPGLLNTLDAIEAAAAEGVTRVEFLGGAERYKTELADRFEPLHLGVGLPNGAAGRVAVTARVALLSLRERLKRSATARRVYDTAAPVIHRVRGPKDVLRA